MNKALEKNSLYKPSHSIINMEDIDCDVLYPVTINPIDSYQHFSVVGCRITSCYTSLKNKILFGSAAYAYFRLYPELSSKGRFHWHGYVNIHDPIKFYLYSVPELLKKCTMVIKPVFTKDIDWVKYCTKQHLFHTYITTHRLLQVPVSYGVLMEGTNIKSHEVRGPSGRNNESETPRDAYDLIEEWTEEEIEYDICEKNDIPTLPYDEYRLDFNI